MIGIPELDRLSSEQMIDILEGKLKILIKDPAKIQVTVNDIPEPTLNTPDFLPQDTVDLLLKMELETRLGWHYLAEKIKEIDKKYA